MRYQLFFTLKKLLKQELNPKTDTKPEKQTKLLLKRLIPFIKPDLKLIAFAAGMLLAASACAIPQPLFTKYIVDYLFIQPDQIMLALVVGFLLAIMLLESIASFFKKTYFATFEQKVFFRLQDGLIKRILHLPKAFFESKQSGYLTSRIASEVFRLRIILSSTLVELIASVLKFVGGIAVLFFLHWKLAALALFVLPFFYLSVQLLSARSRQTGMHSMEQFTQFSKELNESLSGIELIKAYASEKQETKKLQGTLNASLQANFEHSIISAFAEAVIGTIAALGTVAVLWYGSAQVMAGHLSVGSFVAFNAYLAYLYGPSRFIATMHVHLQTGFAALERVFELYDLIPEDENRESKLKVERLQGQIEFENVSFSYEIEPVLQNINFNVLPGEKIAIVGTSGAGKSTLAHLILRFYQPQSGTILFDGRPAEEYNLHSLRERIAIVSQEIFLFNDSIINNLRWARQEATDEEIKHAAHQAKAHEFISQLPDSYATKVGERGVKLSAGQKQRISIARALLKNPDIFIFDEATSALDALTEEDIKQTLFAVTQGETRFIITHRMALAADADRIFLMHSGKLVAQGHHRELYSNCEIYHQMWQGQNEKRALSAVHL